MLANFHLCNIAKTYVLADDVSASRVWGYVTLMNGEVILNQSLRTKDLSIAANYEAFPAVKIARLAIDKKFQGLGFGKDVLNWAIDMIKDKISSYVGCRFLVVDAKPDSVSFYEKLGFEKYNQGKTEEYPSMYLDLFSVNPRLETLSHRVKNSSLRILA